jgi:hypothetical protein
VLLSIGLKVWQPNCIPGVAGQRSWSSCAERRRALPRVQSATACAEHYRPWMPNACYQRVLVERLENILRLMMFSVMLIVMLIAVMLIAVMLIAVMLN